MRTAIVTVTLVALGGWSLAFAAEPYTSNEGKYSVKFPDTPKVLAKTAKTALGEVTVNVATYALSDGSTYMVSYADFPAEATKAENRESLFDGIRDGIKGKDGKLIGDEKELTLGPAKWPGREFTIDKGRKRMKFRVFLRDNRVYQIAVIGTESFLKRKEATAFLESFEITK